MSASDMISNRMAALIRRSRISLFTLLVRSRLAPRFIAALGICALSWALTGFGSSIDPLDNWSLVTPNGQLPLNILLSFGYGNGLYVAVGGRDGGNLPSIPPAVAVSFDGTHWESRSLPDQSTLRSVTFGHGLFVAVELGEKSLCHLK